MFATAAEHKGPGLISLDGHLRSGIAGCAVCRFYSSEEAVYLSTALVFDVVPPSIPKQERSFEKVPS